MGMGAMLVGWMQVLKVDADQWCEDNGGIAYFEVSAKDATNVDKAFNEVALAAYGHFTAQKVAQEKECVQHCCCCWHGPPP